MRIIQQKQEHFGKFNFTVDLTGEQLLRIWRLSYVYETTKDESRLHTLIAEALKKNMAEMESLSNMYGTPQE